MLYFFLLSLIAACLPEWFSPFVSYLPTNPYVLAPVISVANLILFNTVWGLPNGYLMVALMNKAHPFDKNSKADLSYGHLNEDSDDDKNKED